MKTCTACGVPQPVSSFSVNRSMPQELEDKLSAEAERLGVTKALLIRRAVEQYLGVSEEG